ncbi:MAG: DNA polymerase I [Bacteroidales bacterium]|nr:DNA polymerase I [Bacteroidales bacterium]
MAKRLYLVDAYAMIYRAFYAFIRSPRKTSKGVDVSAVFGFVNMFVDLVVKEKPEYVAVAFDSHGPTFRHNIYSEYKANRPPQPEGITTGVPLVKQFLEAMNVRMVALDGYEADDIVGTLAHKFAADVDEVIMVTPDKDYAQLIGGNIKMLRPTTSGAELWTESEAMAHFGLKHSSQMIELLALWGDASDNIPGCPGVGEKRAKELLNTYDSIDGIYANIDQLKGKLRENIENSRDQIMLSKELATININSPIDITIDDCKFQQPNNAKLTELFTELEFRGVGQRIDKILNPQPEPNEGLFAQGSLFSTEQLAEVTKTYVSAKTVEHTYVTIKTEAETQKLVEELTQKGIFAFDTETTSIETDHVTAIGAKMIVLTISCEAHKAYYIPFADDDESKRKISILKQLFENKDVVKIGHNLKFDIEVLANYGVSVEGQLFDTMIAHFLLYPGQKHGLKDITISMLNYESIRIDELIGSGKNQRSMQTVDEDLLREYSAEDADVTWQIYEVMKPQIEASASIKNLFENIDMPLVAVLADMERTGVAIDSDALNTFATKLKEQIDTIVAEVKALAGADFNIASPRQVGEVLFEKMKIDPTAKKTRSGQYSTDEDTLKKYADQPIVAKILDYRGLVKLLNTYAEALPKLVNKTTGRLHTSFNQTVVITGRLSSSNPNLQNIPIRDENGKEIRKAFVAGEVGHKIVAADYSQVELRLMAHLSGDENLIEAFKRGDDIHAATAAKVFGVPFADVTKDMRRKAKTANFGIIYGISAFGLAERLGISRSDAKKLIDDYFVSFPSVHKYMEDSIKHAREKGYVETLFGRRRDLPDINSRNPTVRGTAERFAINAPIQGSAADIMKIAMTNVYKALKTSGMKAKMMLQVHDELVFDCPADEVEQLSTIVKREMENAYELRVPLIAEVGVGENWLDAH